MRALVQRVQSARVEVDHRTVSQIGPGLLVLVGFYNSDTEADADSICQKVLNMPMFDNAETGSPSDQSVMQKNYELLLVSQFTLYGVFKGNRLDFHDAMPSHRARSFYEALFERFCQAYNTDKVKDGIFGVKRQVFLINNGPIAVQLDSQALNNEED